MLGDLLFSDNLIVVWKSLHTDEELAVIDGPNTPLFVLGEPILDPFQPDSDLPEEEGDEEFFLVLCITPAGVGYVNHKNVAHDV
jgi:hypothetical protein